MFDETEYSETIPGGDVQPEYWKEIAPGYWLSDWGNLYSFKSKKVLKPKKLDKIGHVGYSLCIDGKRKYYYQHRLMAEEFIPKDDESHNIVRHLNDIPDDNDINNLTWGTYSDNALDRVENGHANCRSVYATNLQEGFGRKPRFFRSIADAASELDLQPANIGKVLSGDREHTEGWIFSYAEDYKEVEWED